MTSARPDRHLASTIQINKQIDDCREAIARSLAVLRSCPVPDTFAGRKTQKPVPQEPSSVKID